MRNQYAKGNQMLGHHARQTKLQISLEVLLSMSVAMLIALYVVSSFSVAYSSYGKIHTNESLVACAAINLSNNIANECAYCVGLAKSEC